MTHEEMKQLSKTHGISIEKMEWYRLVPLDMFMTYFLDDLKEQDGMNNPCRPGKSKSSWNIDASKAQYIREGALPYEGKPTKKQGEYTIEDYYAWPKDQRIELIDGMIFYMESPSLVHQDISSVMYDQISAYIRRKKGTCIPRYAPIDVRLDCDDKTMVQPDIIILCDPSKKRRWGVMGAPDFVVEITSLSTRSKDCNKKLQKYIDAGVKEYWIIDPGRELCISYDWRDEYLPHVRPLTGTVGVAIFQEELQIDLGEIAAIIEMAKQYPE